MINTTTPIKLNIGDKIGFVRQAQDIDSNDVVIFFPVVEITERDGETAYLYQYPDGEISRAAIRESELQYHVIELQPRPAPARMICLNDRKDEFKKALRRGLDNEFDVYAGWDRDTFFVTNKTNKTEYKVEFKTADGKVNAECECKDFVYRKHLCKHIAEVLQETFFGVNLAV